MKFKAAFEEVFNRGRMKRAFLEEMVKVIGEMPEDIFLSDNEIDVFGKGASKLGPYETVLDRRAAMCEFLRVLGLFESGGDHREGVDTSRLGADTPENAEAGAWQASYDSRRLHPDLLAMLEGYRSELVPSGIHDGVTFQRVMKFDHGFSIRYAATLMSHNAMHNGPLYKGAERAKIRLSLRGEKHSIYPYLSRAAMAEFKEALTI